MLVNFNEDMEGEVVFEDDVVWVGDVSYLFVGDSILLVFVFDGCMYWSRVIEELK